MKTNDMIMVKSGDLDNWKERIFLYQNPNNKEFVCVDDKDEEAYRKGEYGYSRIYWEYGEEIPKPEYIPYDSVEEFLDRLPYGLVRFGNEKDPSRIVDVDEDTVYIAEGCNISEYDFEEFLSDYKWFSDGSPCGKLKGGN